MLNLISYLYAYAQKENLESRLVSDWGEYTMNKHQEERAYEALEELPQHDLLDRFLDQHAIVESLEREALFAAGLTMGLGLGRL